MDAEGNLYLNGAANGKKLYKHSGSVGLYGGNVSDNEPAVIKKVTLHNRGYDSYSVTGLYAPAYEVIKVEISGNDMNATNGIRVHIGQALYNQKANNIWAARSVNRMPVILNTMVVDKNTATYDENRDVWTAYVGSFGGSGSVERNVDHANPIMENGRVCQDSNTDVWFLDTISNDGASEADGDRNTSIHTKDGGLGISEDKKLLLTIDMGEIKTANRMIIYAQVRGWWDSRYPKNFKLEGSIDGTSFFPIGDFKNTELKDWTVTVNFDNEYTFRYYKLTITASSGASVNISEIEMWNCFNLKDGDKISPDNESVHFKGNWAVKSIDSDFGHVYVGKKGATVEFEGEYFGILSSTKLNGNFEVYIDGKKGGSLNLKESSGATALTYLSKKLSDGKHRVQIKCLDSNSNISAIVTR